MNEALAADLKDRIGQLKDDLDIDERNYENQQYLIDQLEIRVGAKRRLIKEYEALLRREDPPVGYIHEFDGKGN